MKNIIKKILFIYIVLCLPIILFGCEEEMKKTGIEDFTIYAMNDFHGMLYETGPSQGISKIGKFLKDNKDNDPNTLIISSGDMFQGSAVSSMSRGKAVVECMNYIGFDAMTIGNHEFDWGIEEVMKYQDGKIDNGEATFPFLAANIFNKGTDKLASFANPYEVIEKDGVKIGVIGIIGSDEENDIFVSYVSDYEFNDEFTAIKKYAKILRTKEKCNIVIVSAHCDTSSINQKIASLDGEEKIDAILNGHTHQYYYGEINRGNGIMVPYVQSGCYGQYIGKVVLSYDFDKEEVVDSSASYLETKSMREESIEINNILKNYQSYFDLANEELGNSKETYYNGDLFGRWSCDVMKDSTSSNLAIVNKGGIRGNGFPIYENQMITYGDIFEISPFENMVRSVKLKGSVILDSIVNSGSFYISNNVDKYNRTIDGQPILRDEYYQVSTVDYVFEKYGYFKTGIDRFDTLILFRDMLSQGVKDNVKKNNVFIIG